MAVINSITFSQASYTPGQTVEVTVDYTPDTPGVTTQSVSVTVNVTDQSGNILTTDTATFTVNTPQAGDSVTVSDSGDRTWTQVSDNGTVAVFTAIA
jgi:hypothetical protein